MFHTLRTHWMSETHTQAAPVPVTGTAPLSEATRGMYVRIVQINGGQRMRKRLADLGLAVGMEVRILRDACGHGPMIISVRHDTRLALGWGMASKITARVEREG